MTREENNETYKNNKHCNIKGQLKEWWMRGMPDIMPVCMQNFLHSCKPKLPEEVILHQKETGT
jgi:hypothetical protein